MTLGEKIKSIFAKAQDEAMKMAEDESGMEKKDDAKDAGAYDELVQICKDLSAKVDALGKSKDAEKDDMKKDDEKKDDSKDEEKKDDDQEKKAEDDDQVEASIEDRLKALEASVSKLLEGMAKDSDEEKSEDEDMDMMDDDMEENTMTGDALSRIEILAPGMKAAGKDAKAKALKTAYSTKEGKKVIDSLTAGKPTFDSANVDTLFIAASEVLKASRASDLSRTKQGSSTEDSTVSKNEIMTAEKMNELNKEFYNRA